MCVCVAAGGEGGLGAGTGGEEEVGSVQRDVQHVQPGNTMSAPHAMTILLGGLRMLVLFFNVHTGG